MLLWKILFPLVCMVAVLSTSGCEKSYERDTMAGVRDTGCRMVVAVMPFQGVSESPGSGLIVADIMANELYALGGYTLVTPEVAAARAAPREGETLAPDVTGRLVGADYILTGRVTEYTYKSGVGEQPDVGVTARLIEAFSGRVLWSGTRAKTGSAAWFQEDSLGLLTSRICRDLALSLDGKRQEYAWGSREDDFYMQNHPVVKELEPQQTTTEATADSTAVQRSIPPAADKD